MAIAVRSFGIVLMSEATCSRFEGGEEKTFLCILESLCIGIVEIRLVVVEHGMRFELQVRLHDGLVLSR